MDRVETRRELDPLGFYGDDDLEWSLLSNDSLLLYSQQIYKEKQKQLVEGFDKEFIDR